jgi:hypothetical protein
MDITCDSAVPEKRRGDRKPLPHERWHRGCFREDMIDLALCVLALVAGGFTSEIFSAARALQGDQDEHGFHLGFEAYHHAES